MKILADGLLQASQNIRNELDNLYGSVFVCESDESLGGIMNNIYKPGYLDCIAVKILTKFHTNSNNTYHYN